jgi:hypothetical protein
MLDLTLQKKLYEIKWITGEVLKLNPPTEKAYRKILNLRNSKDDEEVMLELVYETTREIINNNTKKMVVENKADSLSLDTCLLVIQDYFEYYNKQLKETAAFQQTQQTAMI